jgi:hypothetical protein
MEPANAILSGREREQSTSLLPAPLGLPVTGFAGSCVFRDANSQHSAVLIFRGKPKHRPERLAQHRTSELQPTNSHCVPAPCGATLLPITLRAYPGFASVARISLTYVKISRSCESPKKAKANTWLLIEKEMQHRHNSVFARLDHSEPTITVTNANSNADR